MRFSRTLRAPAKTQELTLRYTPSGRTRWALPQVEKVAASATKPVRIAVATGTAASRRQHGIKSITDNVEFYADLCRSCADEADLIVLPAPTAGAKDRPSLTRAAGRPLCAPAP